jgi:hypothetical protein
MTATTEARKARAAALNDLDWHWGGAYDLAVTRAGWVAKRLDNNRALVAGSPEELRALILADYTTAQMPSGGSHDRLALPAGLGRPHPGRRAARRVPAVRRQRDHPLGQ